MIMKHFMGIYEDPHCRVDQFQYHLRNNETIVSPSREKGKFNISVNIITCLRYGSPDIELATALREHFASLSTMEPAVYIQVKDFETTRDNIPKSSRKLSRHLNMNRCVAQNSIGSTLRRIFLTKFWSAFSMRRWPKTSDFSWRSLPFAQRIRFDLPTFARAHGRSSSAVCRLPGQI